MKTHNAEIPVQGAPATGPGRRDASEREDSTTAGPASGGPAAQISADGPAGGGIAATVLRALRARGGTIALIVVLLVVTGLIAPQFFEGQNLLNVARNTAVTGVVAIGMTFVILTGGIDLSVGAILALVNVLFAMLLASNVPVPLAILAALLIGLALGAINGIGATVLRIQPFIMTLATLAILAGVALVVTQGAEQSFSTNSSIIDFFGNGSIGQIPGPFIVFLVTAAIAWVVLRYLPFGRFVYAVGGSAEAARLSGVRVSRVVLSVYAISGVCAALAAVITAARLSTGEPTAGAQTNLDAIAAVVIGGTSLMGGSGSIVGTIAGSFLLAMVANILDLVGVSPYNQQIAKGLIIIVAVLATQPELRLEIARRIRRGGAP